MRWTQGHEVCICNLGRLCVLFLYNTLLFLTVPLSTQEYKWVAEISQESLIKCQRGGGEGGGEESWGVAGVGWTDILSRGYVGSYTPSCFI